VLLALSLAACTSRPASDGAIPETPGSGWRGTPPSGAPSFLVLLTDDQSSRLFTRDLMPQLFSRIVDRGANFTRAYVNVPLCCPSRASILTGLAARHTGVENNTEPLHRGELARPTFARALFEAGYRTMMAGKYLNSEPCHPRLGWDRWVCGGRSHVDPTLNIDGTSMLLDGFTTDILADHVIDFIRDPASRDRPFFVYYSPKSPHGPTDDPRARDRPFTYPSVPSMDAQPDPAAIPAWARRPPLDEAQKAFVARLATGMAQQLPPLDANIGRILDALGPRAENTVVIFLSDNGFLYGEHRLGAKGMPYEEAVRVPFAIRYPKLLPAGDAFASDALVSSLDVAATIMDLAGVEWGGDGRSLVPLLSRRSENVRDAVLFEWCRTGRERCVQAQQQIREELETGGHVPPPYWGIETDRYVLIEYDKGEAELYDLRTDPFQLRNLAADPRLDGVRRDLSARLERLLTEPDAPETTIAVGPSGEVRGSRVSFEFFSPALSTRFRCRLTGPDTDRSAACDDGRASYAELQAGSYTFRAEAVDADGNADPSPAERRFTFVPGS
jgi:N-acetylglucosamine-6-sulfatase